MYSPFFQPGIAVAVVLCGRGGLRSAGQCVEEAATVPNVHAGLRIVDRRGGATQGVLDSGFVAKTRSSLERPDPENSRPHTCTEIEYGMPLPQEI